MKKIPMVLALLLLIAIPVTAQISAQKPIALTLMRYQPLPAERGNFIDVWLLVSNQREEIRDFKIEYLDEYPFSLSEDQNHELTIPSIPALEDVIIQYRIRTDLEARNQEYNLTWKYTHKDKGGIIEYKAPVYVQATDASLTVDSYEISPHPVPPGAQA